MSKKNRFLICLGLVLISFFLYVYITDFNLYSIANDSGFDTSYSGDSGSSSSSSSWDSSDDLSGGGSLELFGFLDNLVCGIFTVIVLNTVNFDKKRNKIIVMILAMLLALLRILLMLFMFFPLIAFIVISIQSRRLNKKRARLKKDPETIKLLENGYNIFYEVQMAWMNFDYDKLRELTTDELYNTYYNQLQTLSVKGQKNVMSDFEVISKSVEDIIKTDDFTTVKMKLNVKFYDYIVDESSKIVRGTSARKANMSYLLTFIYKDNFTNTCPSCGAKVNAKTVCEYCGTHIQGVGSDMKLSNKKLLNQR